jgi:hypothetical protein
VCRAGRYRFCRVAELCRKNLRSLVRCVYPKPPIA